MAEMAKAFKLTADLIQRRDDLKRIMGPAYDTEVVRAILRGCAKEHNRSLADEALLIAKKMDRNNLDPSIIFAALVDECEAETI